MNYRQTVARCLAVEQIADRPDRATPAPRRHPVHAPRALQVADDLLFHLVSDLQPAPLTLRPAQRARPRGRR
jgi:hypothetical protein